MLVELMREQHQVLNSFDKEGFKDRLDFQSLINSEIIYEIEE